MRFSGFTRYEAESRFDMKQLFLALLVLLLPCAAFAQTVSGVQFVVSGGAAPVTNLLPIGSFQCGQTPSAAVVGTVSNPTAFEYTDPSDATKVCRFKDPGNGPLLSLPFGGTTYTSTAAFVNAVGTGPVSNVSNPFARPGTAPAVAPAALRVVP